MSLFTTRNFFCSSAELGEIAHADMDGTWHWMLDYLIMKFFDKKYFHIIWSLPLKLLHAFSIYVSLVPETKHNLLMSPKD